MPKKSEVSAARPRPRHRVRPSEPFLARDALACGPQLEFPVVDPAEAPVRRFRDSAFMENREVPVHRWIPWIAGFSSTFVDDCMREFLPGSARRRPCVLDPFAGVGTTLVAALTAGNDTVGFEINPYAALACRAKIAALRIDPAELGRQRRRYAEFSRNGSHNQTGSRPADFVTRIPFFSPSVEKQVFGFQAFLHTVRSPEVADLFRLAFGAVMVSFSNYTYEPSLCSRPGAGKPLVEDADVHGSIMRKLDQMLHDVTWLRSELKTAAVQGEGTVHQMSFMDSQRVLKPASIDLVVTSPPYMNNYHYVRSTRPQLHWLDLVKGRVDLRGLEENNVGKYWQTVRDSEPVDLEFEDTAVRGLLSKLRSTRTGEGAYGGPGWANYVASYLNDTQRYLAVMKPSLVRGGTVVIVIGNSIIQGHEIKVDRILAEAAARLGYEVLGIEMLRTKRVGASITKSAVRRGLESRATLYESAVMLRKR